MTSLSTTNTNNSKSEIYQSKYFNEIKQIFLLLTKETTPSKNKISLLKNLEQYFLKNPSLFFTNPSLTPITNKLHPILQSLCIESQPELFEESLSLYLTTYNCFKKKTKSSLKQFFENIILPHLQSKNLFITYPFIIIKLLSQHENTFSFLLEIYLNFYNEKYFITIIKALTSIILCDIKNEKSEKKIKCKDNAIIIIKKLIEGVNNYCCSNKLSSQLITVFTYEGKNNLIGQSNEYSIEQSTLSDDLVTPSNNDNSIGFSKKENADILFINPSSLTQFNSQFQFHNKYILVALNEYFSNIEIDIDDNTYSNEKDKFKLNQTDFFIQAFSLLYQEANSFKFKSVRDIYYLTSTIIFLHLKLINNIHYTFNEFMLLLDGIEISDKLKNKIYYDINTIYSKRNSFNSLSSLYATNGDCYLDITDCSSNHIKELILSIHDDVIFICEYLLYSENFSLQEHKLKSIIDMLINMFKITLLLNIPEITRKIINILIKDISSLDIFLTRKLTLNRDIPIIKSLLELFQTSNHISSSIYYYDIWNHLLHLIFNIFYITKTTITNKTNKETMIYNKKLISQEIDETLYEKVFTITPLFNYETLINFISSLSNEITSTSCVQDFQKLFDIAENNIHRIHFICKIIWNKIIHSLTFNIDTNETLKHVLNIIRQLNEIYIEKEVIDNKQELFGFEYDYFVPFKMIWSYNDDIDIKEYTLEIIKHLISKKGNKINSGWIIIFEIYSSIDELNKTDTKHVNIIDEVFKSLTYITSNHLNETFMSVYFDYYIQCLSTIAKKYPCDLYEIIDILNSKNLNEKQIQQLLSIYVIIILNNKKFIREQIHQKLFTYIKYILTTLQEQSNLNNEFFTFLIEKVVIPIIKESLDKKYYDNINNVMKNILCIFEEYNTMNVSYVLFEKVIQIIPKLLNRSSYANVNEINMDIAVECIEMISTMTCINNYKYLECFINVIYLSIKALSLGNVVSYMYSKFEYSAKFINEVFSVLSNIIAILMKVFDNYIMKEVFGVNDIKLCIDQLMLVLDYVKEYNNKVKERMSKCKTTVEYDSSQSCKVLYNTIELVYKLLETQIDKNVVNERNNNECDNYFVDIVVNNSLKIMEWFNYLDNKTNLDVNINDNKEIIEIKEWEYIKNELAVTLEKFVFPLLKKVKVYTLNNVKKDYMKMLIQMILCENASIRKEVKEMIGDIFMNSNK